MMMTENFRIALRALVANKLRSALTMLGVIIGVGAVVALMAIGQGATASITGQVEGIGSNLIDVRPGRLDGGLDERVQLVSQAALYLEDYNALLEGLDNIAGIAPLMETGATVTHGRATLSSIVTGTTPDFASVRAYEVARGRFLTESDRDQEARVAVIGSQTAKDLFGGLNPVGRSLKINGISFEVVGMLKEKGTSGFGSADEIILVPLETFYAKLEAARIGRGSGQRALLGIQVSAASAEVVNDVIAQTERILRREHGLSLREEADFLIQSQTQILGTVSAITTTLTIFLAAIAGISLFVGGIGIMNIMMVSVVERTKEIGLRKAVGATQGAILGQFLVETLALSLIGGLLGIGLGWGIAVAVQAANLIEAQVTSSSVSLAFGFAAVVGVFFGLYPAWRASRLRPIEALRYE